MFGEVIRDEGGATAVIKLDGRAKPLPFHKGMLYAKKLSPEWCRLTGATRDFSNLRTKRNQQKSQVTEPISKRLRSRKFK